MFYKGDRTFREEQIHNIETLDVHCCVKYGPESAIRDHEKIVYFRSGRPSMPLKITPFRGVRLPNIPIAMGLSSPANGFAAVCSLRLLNYLFRPETESVRRDFGR